MTNRLALVLGVLIVLALAVDVLVNDSVALLFLLRKFFDFVEWAAFWR